jgi:hypothetical protein
MGFWEPAVGDDSNRAITASILVIALQPISSAAH